MRKIDNQKIRKNGRCILDASSMIQNAARTRGQRRKGGSTPATAPAPLGTAQPCPSRGRGTGWPARLRMARHVALWLEGAPAGVVLLEITGSLQPWPCRLQSAGCTYLHCIIALQTSSTGIKQPDARHLTLLWTRTSAKKKPTPLSDPRRAGILNSNTVCAWAMAKDYKS